MGSRGMIAGTGDIKPLDTAIREGSRVSSANQGDTEWRDGGAITEGGLEWNDGGAMTDGGLESTRIVVAASASVKVRKRSSRIA
jgi:hypothetical protein